MRELNFNTINRYTFRVILDDDQKTALDVKLATKGMIQEVLDAYQRMIRIDDDETANRYELLNELYKLCSRLLSYNRQSISYSPQDIENMWNFDDITLFIQTYIDFIYDISHQKN